ncbi:MAG: nitroreductase [Actinomycetaceae bacterium]|nr:nitroreductase [Actinomycetaceae bacterium]
MAGLLDVIKARRSFYQIGTNTDKNADDVVAALRAVISSVPSAVNSQSSRLVVVTGEKHVQLWNMIEETQRGALSKEMFKRFAPRFTLAKKGLGTILFFEERQAVEDMPLNESRQELYKHENHAFATYAAWLALQDLGLGASLQHYNIGYEQGFDKEIREFLDLPAGWEMLAQMPFGSIDAEADDKPRLDPTQRVIKIS